MKPHYLTKLTSLALAGLMLVFSSPTAGQADIRQNELTGIEAADIIPGTRYIMEGNSTPYPAYVILGEQQRISEEDFIPWLRESIDLGADIDLILISEEVDELNIHHKRFQETFLGIPVEYAIYHAEFRDGYLKSFNGEIHNIPNLPSTPSISEENALTAALKHIAAPAYMWENPFWENEIKERTGDPSATYYPQGEVRWGMVPAEELSMNTFTLVYSFDIYAEGGLGSRRVQVDASDGTIINSIPLESNCSSASITDIYNSTSQTIYTDKYTSDDYRLNDGTVIQLIHVPLVQKNLLDAGLRRGIARRQQPRRFEELPGRTHACDGDDGCHADQCPLDSGRQVYRVRIPDAQFRDHFQLVFQPETLR